jgi:hypothetical protein
MLNCYSDDFVNGFYAIGLVGAYTLLIYAMNIRKAIVIIVASAVRSSHLVKLDRHITVSSSSARRYGFHEMRKEVLWVTKMGSSFSQHSPNLGNPR